MLQIFLVPGTAVQISQCRQSVEPHIAKDRKKKKYALITEQVSRKINKNKLR